MLHVGEGQSYNGDQAPLADFKPDIPTVRACDGAR